MRTLHFGKGQANDYLKPTVGTNSLQISSLLQSYFLREATQLPGGVNKCGCNNHSAVIFPCSKEHLHFRTSIFFFFSFELLTMLTFARVVGPYS